VGEIASAMSSAEPPRFSEQGQMVGKQRGRKAKKNGKHQKRCKNRKGRKGKKSQRKCKKTAVCEKKVEPPKGSKGKTGRRKRKTKQHSPAEPNAASEPSVKPAKVSKKASKKRAKTDDQVAYTFPEDEIAPNSSAGPAHPRPIPSAPAGSAHAAPACPAADQDVRGDGRDGGEGGDDDQVTPFLREGSQMRKPPAHTTANHVYSSAYRQAKAKQNSKEECRDIGQTAAKLFRQTGLVDDRCGIFREKPRSSKTDTHDLGNDDDVADGPADGA